MSRTSLVSSILAISGILIGVSSFSLQSTQALELANGQNFLARRIYLVIE